jgi:membrane associated rhomboid family serine protease
MAASLLPFEAARQTYGIPTVGASGAVYGLIIAWAMLFPHRTILFMLLFPMPARIFALLMGAMAFYGTLRPGASAVSDIAHLGGFVIGWLYLKGPRDFRAELRYRLTRWRIERMRRRFDVHQGGRDRDKWRDRIH